MKLQFPYKNEQNQRYSKQLFFETWRDLPVEQRLGEPPFTLNMEKDGLISFHDEYIQDADPTGYKTSTRLLGDFAYWKHLMKAGWFRDAVAQWDEELEAKLQSEALDKIREISRGDDPKALAAAKFLATKEYKKTGATKRGRPSKDELEGRLNQEAEEIKKLQDDAARIRLVK